MIRNLLDKIKKIIPDHLYFYDLFLFVFVITVCFVLFQHGDLFHTSSSSYAYLNGHIRNFYDYNKNIVGGNDYLPLIYIIFAIWNFPLKVFGLMHNVAETGITLSVVELIWTKLLLVVFYFATTYVIYLIGKTISGQSKKAKYIAIIFATSPIAIFAVYIFGQYDIIEIFLLMLGFYYYIKHDYLKFSIIFSFAISIKYFPLIVFIPLLLLAEKRILYIIKYIGISLGATLLQIAIYYNNVAFRNEYFTLGIGKLSGLANFTLSPLNNSPYFVIVYAIICIYAYIKNVDQTSERNKTAVFISLFSYSVMFSTVLWHPQWLIIIMPFFALSYLYVKDVSKSYILDLLGMFSFIYIVVNFFARNVDSNMLRTGILRAIFTYIPLSNSSLFLPKFVNIFMGIFFVYLFSPLLIQLFQRTIIKEQEVSINNYMANKFLRARFYIGVAIFVIPSLFSAFVPKNIAQKIDPTAYVISGLSITTADKPVGNINGNTIIEQSFVAENDNLYKIGLQLATWERLNNSVVTLTLLDKNNNIVAMEKIDGKVIVDNAFYEFTFDPIKNSGGEKYSVVISSNADNENSITAWQSNNDVYKSGVLSINGKENIGDLCMKLFYEK